MIIYTAIYPHDLQYRMTPVGMPQSILFAADDKGSVSELRSAILANVTPLATNLAPQPNDLESDHFINPNPN